MIHLRRFNERGILEFARMLEHLRQGHRVSTPLHFLKTDDMSDRIWQDVQFEVQVFETRNDLALFVDNLVSNAGIDDDMADIGLWSWLGAAFLDTTCPEDAEGIRKPGQDYRHIPSDNWRDFYRHLIRGPVRILRLFRDNPDNASIVLCQKPHAPGDFVEQLASRQERITNPAILETANRLYFDRRAGRPKRGASPTSHRPGTLRRFGDVLDQLDLTYDLYSMSADDLIQLLPAEFSIYMER